MIPKTTLVTAEAMFKDGLWVAFCHIGIILFMFVVCSFLSVEVESTKLLVKCRTRLDVY